MNDGQLKERITQRLWEVVAAEDSVLSATIAGSFLNAASLEGLSDIDFIVVVDELNSARFEHLIDACEQALQPVLAEAGYRLRINPTLGPLKFNEEKLAVLHLMLYSAAAHVDHVILSPFTCLDWQQHGLSHKRSLSDIYPTFGLQPKHFMSARRGLGEYLRDYQSRVVSYRELECDENDYREVKRTKPMEVRDRYEFAYHVLRFLMRNLLKLATRRASIAANNERMMEEYFGFFPDSESRFATLFRELCHRKQTGQFHLPIDNLDAHVEAFVASFERQFRDEFIDGATRHVAMRHAPTPLHIGETRFIGRIDPSIDSGGFEPEQAIAILESFQPTRVLSSPLRRCIESFGLLKERLPAHIASQFSIDPRLIEIDYGTCDGLTVSQARVAHPELFVAWQQGIDIPFPNGESNQQVSDRIQDFMEDQWSVGKPSSLVFTHNAVLRAMIGQALQIPIDQWFRIAIPYMQPISFVRSRRFGVYVNLESETQRTLFHSFQRQPETHLCKS